MRAAEADISRLVSRFRLILEVFCLRKGAGILFLQNGLVRYGFQGRHGPRKVLCEVQRFARQGQTRPHWTHQGGTRAL